MTHNGSCFVGSGLLWYGNSDETSTLRAYYPYSTAGFPQLFSVAADQRSNPSDSDLLGAVKSNVRPSGEAVAMTFHHLFSRVVITVQQSTEQPIASVKVGGLIPTAELDWQGPTATAKAGVATSEVVANEEGGRYVAILVPQRGVMEVTVELTNGTRFSKSVEATLLGGKSYTLTVQMEGSEAAIFLSGEIADWEDGGALGEEQPQQPDPNPDDDPDEPATDETLRWGSTTYRLRTIGDRVWMAENARYLPSEALIGSGVWYPNTPTNLAIDISTSGYLYNYTTILASDFIPAGWHIPSREDLQALIEADCGSDFFTPAGYVKVDGDGDATYNDTNNYLIGTAADQESCYALKYTTAGATEIKTLPQRYGFSLRLVKDK